jgi:GT2 family glycosyltransferase
VEVATDRPGAFEGLPVETRPLSREELRAWGGPSGFGHRRKIAALADALARRGAPAALLDADTYLRAHPDRLFERIGPGRSVMAGREGRVRPRHGPLHAILRAGLRIPFGREAEEVVPEGAPMWNSGVVGVDPADAPAPRPAAPLRAARAPRGAGAPPRGRPLVAHPLGRGRAVTAPAASVVIPTRDRRRLLARVLRALAAQTAGPAAFEAVVVDDASSDGTADLLARIRPPYALRALRERGHGPSAARNAGIEAARGALVVLLDDDVVPRPRLVEEHLRSHAAEADVAVTGPMSSLGRYREPWVAYDQARLERSYRDMARGRLAPGPLQFWSGNASVARAHLLGAGGFDPSLARAEDVELAHRLRARGLSFRFNPRAAGLHHAARTLESWARVREAYGRFDAAHLGRMSDAPLEALLAASWHERRPATRRLLRLSAGGPLRERAALAVLRAAVALSVAVPLPSLGYAACSALANALYWGALARALGEDPARLYARLEGAAAGGGRP